MAGFTGREKTAVNQALPVFQPQFYQWFTNISEESGLRKQPTRIAYFRYIGEE